MDFQAYSKTELQAALADLQKQYEIAKNSGLLLDMSRGKPNADQVALSADLLRFDGMIAEDGTHCGNYGAPDGIPEARRLMASLLDADPAEIGRAHV